jgi:hypothetical protein
MLREAGLLTTGARGVNAPEMKPLDAARLLIGLMVTDKPSLAVAAVSDFGKLPCREPIDEETLDIPEMQKLADWHDLEEALATVIEVITLYDLRDFRSRYAWLKREVDEAGGVELEEEYIALEVSVGGCSASLRWFESGPWTYEKSVARQEAIAGLPYQTRIKVWRAIGDDVFRDIAAGFRDAGEPVRAAT